jgi:hypothetical protein
MNDLRKRVEENPFVFLAGAVAAGATAAAGVTAFFGQRAMDLLQARHALEVQRYEAQLQSIDRKIGDARFLDVRSLFVSKSAAAAPPSDVFVPDAGLYAPADDFWKYERLKEAELSLRAEDAGAAVKDALRKTDAYRRSPTVSVWSQKDAPRVKAGGVSLFPYILVRRVPLAEFMAASGAPDQPAGDAAGRAFTDAWRSMETLRAKLGPKAALELTAAQKVGNVFYAQALLTAPESSLKGRAAVYVRRECILFTTAADVFTVETVLPGPDPLPNGKAAAKVTEWLSNVRILTD